MQAVGWFWKVFGKSDPRGQPDEVRTSVCRYLVDWWVLALEQEDAQEDWDAASACFNAEAGQSSQELLAAAWRFADAMDSVQQKYFRVKAPPRCISLHAATDFSPYLHWTRLLAASLEDGGSDDITLRLQAVRAELRPTRNRVQRELDALISAFDISQVEMDLAREGARIERQSWPPERLSELD